MEVLGVSSPFLVSRALACNLHSFGSELVTLPLHIVVDNSHTLRLSIAQRRSRLHTLGSK